MTHPNKDKKTASHVEEREITIKDLYPDMSEEELVEAEENLTRYAAFIMRMDARLRAEFEEKAKLTDDKEYGKKEERSNK